MMMQDKNVPVNPPFLVSFPSFGYLGTGKAKVVKADAFFFRSFGSGIVLNANDRQGPFRLAERMAALMFRWLSTSFS